MKKNRYQNYHKRTQQKDTHQLSFNTFIEAGLPIKTQESQVSRPSMKIKRVKTRKRHHIISQVQHHNTNFQQLRNKISLLYNKKSKNKDSITSDRMKSDIQISDNKNKKSENSRSEIRAHKLMKLQDSKFQFPQLAKKCQIFPKKTSRHFYQDISTIFGQKTFYKKQN